MGHDLAVTSDEHVCGDVTVFGGGVAVDGHIDGNLIAFGGDVTVSGTGQVGGSVTDLGGNVTLRPGAYVGGNVNAIGGTVYRDDHAYVGSGVGLSQGQFPIDPGRWLGFTGPYTFPWGRMIFWLLATAALALFFPGHLRRVRTTARFTLPASFFVGLVLLVVGVLLIVVLALTCIGLPLALLFVAALWTASVIGTAGIALWIGEALLRSRQSDRESPLAPALLGSLLLALGESLPCLGGLLTFFLAVTGVGISLIAIAHRQRTLPVRTSYM